MKRCVECRRHLWVTDVVCPFCESPQGELPTAAAKPLLLAIGLATASCGPSVDLLDSGADGGAASDSTTTTTSPGSTAPATTTLPPGTSTTSPPPPGTTMGADEGTSDSADDADSLSFLIYGGGDGMNGGIAECDLWTNDCPDGEKCMPWASSDQGIDATRCTEVDAMPVQPGEPCVVEAGPRHGIDNCDVGVMCYGADPETFEGHCVELCSGSPDEPTCETPGSECWFIETYDIPMCLVACDPLMSTCAPGHACVVIDFDDETSAACIPQRTPAPVGEPCEVANGCEVGAVCAAGGSVPECETPGCCVPFCATDDPFADEACDGAVVGTTCVALFPPESMSTVGACVAL